jgi:hypothetical protein
MRHTLALAAIAMIVVMGSVWAKSTRPQTSITPRGARIDVATMHAGIDVAKLPLLEVREPF